MGTEFCPACRTSREATVQRTVRETSDDDGSVRKIETKSSHCEKCGTFIRSEEHLLDKEGVSAAAA